MAHGRMNTVHGWLLAAVGWLGKVLGPLGMLQLVLSEQWPPAALILNFTNDLIWLPFFSLYLWDAWPMFRHSLAGDDRPVSASQSTGP